ncbi:MAG: sigma-70 family RNA polymerase sigma factor [Planctomycetes bacterium]|nr:sigma-70 family RNA polymerase sigma factor [Planctomycetota bacterium]
MSEPTQTPDPDDVIPAARGEGQRPEEHTLALGASESAEILGQIERAKAGDAAALNDLFARHHGLMVELARRKLGARLRQKEDADDLAQTTFREATRDFRQYQYRGEGSFLRWLMQILQNKIRDKAEYYGANKRDVSREFSSDERIGDSGDLKRYDPPSKDLSVTQVLAREEEFKILRSALEELSPDHRKAITLMFFEGHSLREAGELMEGRSEDAVRMLLRRAESRLHELTRIRLTK